MQDFRVGHANSRFALLGGVDHDQPLEHTDLVRAHADTRHRVHGVDQIVPGFFLGDEVNTGDRDDFINGQLESTIAAGPVERSSTAANRADTLAVVEANWVTGAWSREQTVKQLVAQGHNRNDVNAAIDQLDIDFEFHARLDADFQLRNGNFSRAALIDQLHLGAQFTRAEARAAIDALDPDFVSEVSDFAVRELENRGLSRDVLLEILTDDIFGRFTNAEAEAAINLLDPDFDAEAVQYAEQIGAQEFSCQGLEASLTGFFGRFTPEQARHAGEQLGVC